MPTPVTTIGLAHGRKAGLPFGLRQPDRLQHMLCLGKTGTGRSTLLRTLATQDARHGQGFCLIDPHGDLAQDVFASIEANALYWDLADPSCPYTPRMKRKVTCISVPDARRYAATPTKRATLTTSRRKYVLWPEN